MTKHYIFDHFQHVGNVLFLGSVCDTLGQAENCSGDFLMEVCELDGNGHLDGAKRISSIMRAC